MPAATDPIFAATPKAFIGQVTTADTSRTAPANVATVYTAGSNGTKIEEVVIEGTATNVAGMIRLFIHDGSNYRLFDEITTTATTVSATVPAFRAKRTYPNLWLQSGYSLRATTEKTETWNVIAFGADF